jgi:hypothetical protein
MPSPTSITRPQSGRFVKGISGNPAGRPKGASGREAELRRLEDDAIALGVNVADVIAETARLALDDIGHSMLIPLVEAITDAAKASVKEGQIGPSSVALLRDGYDDHLENRPASEFFMHVGLPSDCSWKAFRDHYTHRGRIDHIRYADDLRSYPPIAQRIKSLTEGAA